MAVSGHNRKLALALAKQGLFVFPCQNAPGEENHKKPHRGVLWRSKATTDPVKIEAWWRLHPEALPGINAGMSGLVVVDLDRHADSADGVAAWATLAEGREVDCPTSDTPSGGRHLIFRQPDGKPLGNSEGGLPDGINVRGDGGYFIAPGAMCLDGKAYVLTGVIADAPQIPGWLVAIIRPERPPPPPRLVVDNSGPKPANEIDRIRDALSYIPADDYNTWIDIGFALEHELGDAGKFLWVEWSRTSSKWKEADHKKWRSFGKRDGITMGTLYQLAILNGWPKAERVEDEGRQQLGAELAGNLIRSAKKRSQGAGPVVQIESGDIIDGETGEIIIDAKSGKKVHVEGLPDRLTRPPGLVGKLVDWIEVTARRPSRTMALAAALLVVGTVIGRERSGPTDSSTHLYIVVFAPTGAGKAHPLAQAKRALEAAGLGDLLGPSDFKSGPGVINAIARLPLSLCCMDEFGAFIRRINDRGSGGFVRDVTRVLRVAWDSQFTTMTTDEGARQQAQAIKAPAMSILAATTPREFYDGLSSSDVLSGFLNRFGMVVAPKRAAERDPPADPFAVPEDLSSQLAHLFHHGNALDNRKRMPQANITPRKVPWANAEAKAIYDAMSAEIEAICDADSEKEAYYARTKEMAVRAATIVACGVDGDNPAVTADIMAWARDLFMYSARAMVAGVSDYVAETEPQRIAKEVVRIIREAGGTIGHSELYQRLKHKHKAGDLKATLASLVEGDNISITPMPGKGRPQRIYQLLKDI